MNLFLQLSKSKNHLNFGEFFNSNCILNCEQDNLIEKIIKETVNDILKIILDNNNEIFSSDNLFSLKNSDKNIIKKNNEKIKQINQFNQVKLEKVQLIERIDRFKREISRIEKKHENNEKEVFYFI